MEETSGETEMETSPIAPPKPPRLTSEEQALAAHVLEIIGGISRGALRSLEEPEEREAWSVEEGDDSVFYSDEDQTGRDSKPNANVQGNDGRVGASVFERGESELMKKEGSGRQVVLLPEQEQGQEVLSPKTKPVDRQSHHTDPRTQSGLSTEKSSSNTREFPVLKCTFEDMQTLPGKSKLAEKVNPPVEDKVEGAMVESQTPNLDETNEKRDKWWNGQPGMSSAEQQISGVHAPAGFHQKPNPAYLSLPLPKKSGDSGGEQKAFDHLASSKYGTVSYRKIRRGNTRKKIEEFEYMTMNL